MNTRSRLGAVLIPIAALALALSCSTTSGGSYQRSVSGSGSAAERSAKAADERAKSSPQPRRDPPRPDPLPPVVGPRPGEAAGGGLFLFLAPPPAPPQPTGTLVLAGIRPGATVFVDGNLVFGTSIVLPVGPHDLHVRRFGFRDYSASVMVLQGTSVQVSVDSVPLAFEVEAIEASPASFDPTDPGAYGSCRIGLRAAAPGRALVEVRDAGGRTVRRLGERTVENAYLSLRWDGRGDDGGILPDGLYRIRAWGAASGAGSGFAEAEVSLARGSYNRSSSLYSGVSGALLAPDARALGAGRAESAAGLLALVLAPDSAQPGRVVTHGGFRVGLGSGKSGKGAFELDVSGLLALYPEQWDAAYPIDSGSVAVALKRNILEGPVSAAFYAKAVYDSFLSSGTWPTDWDGATRYAGLSAGLPIEGAAGKARIFLTPELDISTFYPGYGDGRWPVPGLFAWGYLRAGIEADVGPLALVLSGALRSEPFGGPFAARLPASVGAELRWYSPDSPFSLSLVSAGEIEGPSSYYFMGGLCAAFWY